jgi:hypothetical protein
LILGRCNVWGFAGWAKPGNSLPEKRCKDDGIGLLGKSAL